MSTRTDDQPRTEAEYLRSEHLHLERVLGLDSAARRRDLPGLSKTQALSSASIVAVATIPSTRRASSASRVTNASACS